MISAMTLWEKLSLNLKKAFCDYFAQLHPFVYAAAAAAAAS